MIYLELFFIFLKIGAVSFGGGYGMIAIIRESVVGKGWMTEAELLNFIAVAESTPGPIAVNMATFVGAEKGGVTGALLATLGVILPSFVVILIIAALIRNLLKYAGVAAALRGIRPVIAGLILATSVTMFLGNAFGFSTFGDAFSTDFGALLIFGVLFVFSVIFRKWRKKVPSPIYCILLAGALGILLYL